MGKRKRRRTGSRKPTIRRENLVEGFEVDGVSFIRDGKNIYARNSQTPDQHQQFLAGIRDEMLPELRTERDRLRNRLDEIFDRTGAVDLLARAGFLYLAIDPDTFKEWQSDRSPGHIEYLALQALPRSMDTPPAAHPMEVAALSGEALDTVRRLFEIEKQLLAFGVAERPELMGDQAHQYRVRTQMESLAVRGSAYSEHLRAILVGTLGQFDSDCEQFLGFTAEQAINLIPAMVDVVAARLSPRLEDAARARTELLWHLPRQRRKKLPGPVPDWIVTMKPSDAKRWVGVIALMWAHADAKKLATFSTAEVAAASGIPEPNVQKFLDALTCEPEAFVARHHRFPVGAHPMTETPLLRVPGGYVLPVPSAVLETLRPRMEDLLQQADRDVWERYAKARADFLEKESARRLGDAIPGARISTALSWQSASDNSDLDGLVAVDDVTLRVQAKAGRVHAPSRRGAPKRMKQNLTALIKEAAQQHAALDRALAEEGAAAIGLASHADALSAPFQIEVIVCLDDITVWSTEAHSLRHVGMLPTDRSVPWILSLGDLMAVTDVLQGAQLLHYLTRRIRLEALGKIAAHDELDWLGYYIDRGLYFEDIFDSPDAPSQYRLLSFTEMFDSWYFTREGARTVPAPKPAQPIPPRVGALINRLEQERPTHWSIGAMALLMGGDGPREQMDERLVHAENRRFTHGWSNVTQIFSGTVGLTYYMDYRWQPAQFATMFSAYVDQKMAGKAAPNWIAIGDSGRGTLRVELRQTEARGIVGVFIPGAGAGADPAVAGDVDGEGLDGGHE